MSACMYAHMYTSVYTCIYVIDSSQFCWHVCDVIMGTSWKLMTQHVFAGCSSCILIHSLPAQLSVCLHSCAWKLGSVSVSKQRLQREESLEVERRECGRLWPQFSALSADLDSISLAVEVRSYCKYSRETFRVSGHLPNCVGVQEIKWGMERWRKWFSLQQGEYRQGPEPCRRETWEQAGAEGRAVGVVCPEEAPWRGSLSVENGEKNSNEADPVSVSLPFTITMTRNSKQRQ